MILERFYPDEEISSAYAVPYEELYERGVRGILFDVDNTLVPHGAPATQEAAALFARLREIGLSSCVVSNNQEPRVKPFADAVGTRFLPNAHKPSVKGYLAACRLMGTNPAHTVFIGDQLFTDIWGARRSGIYSILVRPIHPKEEIQIVLKRIPEKLILYFYRKRKKTVEKSGPIG